MNADLSQFSLLWPNEQSRAAHLSGTDVPAIDQFVLEELGLDEILHLKSRDLSDFFTQDPSVIAHRQDVFADMLEHPDAFLKMIRKVEKASGMKVQGNSYVRKKPCDNEKIDKYRD